MNYSTALLESIEAAQILAGHYQGHTLDTWHLLTAMANNPYSVAGSVLNDYPMQIDEFQDAAEHITGQAFQSDNRYEIFPFSYRMEAIMKHAREIAQVLHAKTLGTEHVLLSLLADRGTLASQVMEFAREFLLPLFERILRTRQAGTRMISKPFGVSIAPKTLTAKPWEI